MSQPHTHLSEVAATFGTGDASGPVRSLLELGLKNKLAAEVDTWDPKLVHVSDAGKCPRQLFFRLTGVPKTEELSLDSYVTMRMGNKAEELYLELLEAAGVKVLTQQRVELEQDGETIHGTLDLLLEIPADVRDLIPGLDPVELWETKTKNSRALGWLLKRGGPDPEDGYVKQIRGYLHGAQVRPTHARGRLVYTAVGATRGEPLFHAWFVELDEAEVKKDMRFLAQVMKDAREGRDPGIPEAYKSRPTWPCGYCDWHKHCFPGRTK